ncbi:MAG: DUF1775 domain-containing protein [Alphaproteobacteria bacterium]|nr:MAG: DUF1775 domain-containing protein [Alphaproteobacteria bacterium]
MHRIFAVGIFTLAALLPVSAPATAHVVFATPEAAPGAYYFGELRVGHGCEGLATTAVTVEIPEGIYSAKPQPKAGWTVEIIRESLPEPLAGSHGKVMTDRVARLRWSGGPLSDDMVDQFGLMLKLPDVSGPLYFPVTQTCDGGQTDWTMIPAKGQAWGALKHPAPVLTLKIPDGDAHAHH